LERASMVAHGSNTNGTVLFCAVSLFGPPVVTSV
jgi:hypothetical protein